MSKAPISTSGVWGPYRDVMLPGFWMAEGGQSATGELLRHMLSIHPAFNTTQALAKGKNIYDWLNAYLESKAQRENALSISYLSRYNFFYGDLWGNRSPIADSSMRGVMVGLNSDISTDDLALWYFATMEFIAFQTRQITDIMNKSGHEISSIYMSGSQCQNPVLMNLISTICQMPVVIPHYEQAAVVHGAAMLGAKAATCKDGYNSESLWDTMNCMSKRGRLVSPGKDELEIALFDAKYEVYLDMCNSQQAYRRKVDQATMKWKN